MSYIPHLHEADEKALDELEDMGIQARQRTVVKKKKYISYPDLLNEIIALKKEYQEKSDDKNLMWNRRERKLFRRTINQKVKIWNDGIKVLTVKEV